MKGKLILKIYVVTTLGREGMARRLAEAIQADDVFCESLRKGAFVGHRLVLGRILRDLDAVPFEDRDRFRYIIMEDDALPVKGFRELAEEVLASRPDELVSFYLGTGRPPQWQDVIRTQLQMYDLLHFPTGHISLRQLVHGVCYSIPSRYLHATVRELDKSSRQAIDFAIGAIWCGTLGMGPVQYVVPSLVDHADLPSVEHHPDGQERTEVRKAWRMHQGLGCKEGKPCLAVDPWEGIEAYR